MAKKARRKYAKKIPLAKGQTPGPSQVLADGRFAKGGPGRPVGAKNRKTILKERLIDEFTQSTISQISRAFAAGYDIGNREPWRRLRQLMDDDLEFEKRLMEKWGDVILDRRIPHAVDADEKELRMAEIEAQRDVAKAAAQSVGGQNILLNLTGPDAPRPPKRVEVVDSLAGEIPALPVDADIMDQAPVPQEDDDWGDSLIDDE